MQKVVLMFFSQNFFLYMEIEDTSVNISMISLFLLNVFSFIDWALRKSMETCNYVL